MPLYAALIEYDGAAYRGFQRQRPGTPTIQSELEKALLHISQTPIVVHGAGRTDSGVHAVGQVIGFTIEWPHSDNALLQAINANLPYDIAILQLKKAPPLFHPRFDAQRRAYRYQIYNALRRRPIHRLYSWHVPQKLDVSRMNEAARLLVGVQNFATFGQPPYGENSVRELFTAHWQEEADQLVFYVEANAFLYRMVRSLVGSLKQVGIGSWTVEDFAQVLHAQDRSKAGPTAPAHGLFLLSVTYKNLKFEVGEGNLFPSKL